MQNSTTVDAIIFDLGGVILNLDYQATSKAFFNLGFTDFDILYSQAGQIGLFDKFEIGEISETIFFAELNRLGSKNIPTELLIEAWNAMLLEFNPKALDILHTLKKKHTVYLFSNTNETHYKKFTEIYRDLNNEDSFDALFEKTYYSHFFKKRKPNADAFQAILEENGLTAEKTVFIDDSIQHVNGAAAVGINSFHLKESLEAFIPNNLAFLLT
jgi:glucose-1-phosphatase